MSDKGGKAGYCTAVNPTAVWFEDKSMTDAEGCATLQNNPLACINYGQCTWEMSTGQSPDNYDKQIDSLAKQFSSFLEQRKDDCAKYKSFGSNEEKCNIANMEITNISNTFISMTNDLETDIDQLEKTITGVNTEINKLEKENTAMESKLGEALSLDAGAQGMMIDSQILYNQELMGNWLIALALIGFVGAMFLTKRISVEGVKTQAQVITQKAARTLPGFTSMIPGM